ncbi:MAG: AAA family ATPase, partial [Candidatus Lokiarchaeota archaeon]|nr:AAA family ATPase [Candidatus Lokiarchaeota archaeon]
MNENTIVEKVILKNFNSFQNDEVPLKKGFTVVTGPNGAGKSTVFQGIKFALGSNERDGRNTKWSDFIRIGEKYGSVELHLRKDEKLYKIRRIIQDDAAPYFQIKLPDDKKFHNTTAQKVKDVVKLLEYNPNNVFAFVSQGNVTDIKNMEEKEVCQFIELGLGLTDLREQIFERKNEISTLSKEIKSLNAIKDSASYDLELLRPKLKKLEEKKKLEKKKEKLEKEKTWLNREHLKREITELK